MKVAELNEIKEKIAGENRGKKRQRKENETCFIPEEYYTLRMTRKQIFIMKLKRRLKTDTQREIKGEWRDVYYSD